MSRVFISYIEADAELAENLARRIAEAGFEPLDSVELRAGGDWKDAIDQAIRGAFALVVVLSPAARSAERVTYEWSFALGAGVEIVPLLAAETDLHSHLAALQGFDFTGVMRAWDDLIERLRAIQSDYQPGNVVQTRHDTSSYVQKAISSLKRPSAEERKAAIERLAQSGHESSNDALAAALEHDQLDVRIEAAFALAQKTNYQDGRVVPALLEALGDRHSSTRMQQAAAAALQQVGRAALPGLLRALHDEDQYVRQHAARALGHIGDVGAVTPLIAALHDESVEVCRSAAEALGDIGHASAVPALSAILYEQHDDHHVEELEQKLGTKVGSWFERLEGWSYQQLLNTVVLALERIGTAEALAAVKAWQQKSAK